MLQYKNTNYYVSKDGKVYRKWNDKYKILKPFLNNGYERIQIYFNGQKEKKLIHRLVAELYIPNPNNKLQVNHINGITTDNCIDNLEWSTPKENILHSLNVLGSKEKKYNSRDKLTKNEIQQIKEYYQKFNFTQKDLSEKFKASRHEIGFIIKYELWDYL